ncbi:MAG: response regulator transcription factor [Verrucomicrobiota bacterium]
MNTFLIVDDHALMRSALSRLVKTSFPGAIVDEAPDGDQAIALVKKQPWDIMVLDIGLPGKSGLDVLRDVLDLRQQMSVLILSGMADTAVATRAFECGAKGYLCKDCCSEDNLVEALRKILSGGYYLTPSLAETFAKNLSQRNAQREQSGKKLELRGRILDVLLRMGNGDTVKSIAIDMGLSIKTISTYRTRILERLQLKSNADIVRYCLINKLSR